MRICCVPVHYYGVHEFLGADGTRVDATEGISKKDKQQIQYSLEELTEPSRVQYIIRKLEQYGSYDQPVTGLVFCSGVEEAERLSELFNQQTNQQAERNYRTVAISGKTAGRDVEGAIDRLESGDLDYIFTVDKFNEGVDIPAINQIVMLRNTESSIVFTQQLGRGLRKFPGTRPALPSSISLVTTRTTISFRLRCTAMLAIAIARARTCNENRSACRRSVR